MFFKSNYSSKLIIFTLFLLTFIVSINFAPNKANAQLGGLLGCSSSISFGANKVPVQDSSTDAMKGVQCTWNGIAWQLAHEVLHSLTTSVVNWINSGFEGNPSFMTNPEGFLLDAADQVTGAFIANSGPLSELCSPFSLDIRLSLALSQTNYRHRYACTLSTIINNAKNAKVSVGLNATTNTNTVNNVDGFMGGDFSQGGWPAFMAMTTQPQNNIYGAYLQAQDDLMTQIAERKRNINVDVGLGNGFMSWQKCDELIKTDDNTNEGDIAVAGGYNSGVTTKTNSDGSISYMQCHTETPGSVISSSLDKQLGSSVDELGLTDSINQVVSALFSQLVMKTLSGGLYASAQAGNGSGQSYVNQLSNDLQMQQNFTSLKQQASEQLDQSLASVKQAADYRNQALVLIQSVKNAFLSAQTCISAKTTQTSGGYSSNNTYYQSQLALLNDLISKEVNPKIDEYQTASDDALTALSLIEDTKSQLNSVSTTAELSQMSQTLNTQISSLDSTSLDLQKAKDDLDTANTDAKNLQSLLTPYQNVCSGTGLGSYY